MSDDDLRHDILRRRPHLIDDEQELVALMRALRNFIREYQLARPDATEEQAMAALEAYGHRS